jgi:nucleoside-diphosphate-sugar epimerase
LEFAEKINAFTGNQAGIQFKPLPKDDPKQRQPNIAKAKRILGWEPNVALDQGMATTVDWFAERIKRG